MLDQIMYIFGKSFLSLRKSEKDFLSKDGFSFTQVQTENYSIFKKTEPVYHQVK